MVNTNEIRLGRGEVPDRLCDGSQCGILRDSLLYLAEGPLSARIVSDTEHVKREVYRVKAEAKHSLLIVHCTGLLLLTTLLSKSITTTMITEVTGKLFDIYL